MFTWGEGLYPTDAAFPVFPPRCYEFICISQQTAAKLSEVSTQKLCSVGVADLPWHISSQERPGRGSPRVRAVTCFMAMCQLPTSHWLIINLGNPRDVCHYVPEEAEEWLACEQPTGYPLASLIGCWWLWPCLFPGVLCKGHWHLDGGVPAVCVCRPAGVRSG